MRQAHCHKEQTQHDLIFDKSSFLIISVSWCNYRLFFIYLLIKKCSLHCFITRWNLQNLIIKYYAHFIDMKVWIKPFLSHNIVVRMQMLNLFVIVKIMRLGKYLKSLYNLVSPCVGITQPRDWYPLIRTINTSWTNTIRLHKHCINGWGWRRHERSDTNLANISCCAISGIQLTRAIRRSSEQKYSISNWNRKRIK